MKKLAIIACLFAGSFIVQSCNQNNETEVEQTAENTEYACPMDCEKGKTYAEEGQCPVCGMDLKPVKK